VEPLPVEVSEHASDPPNPWAGYQLALQRGLDDPTNPTHVLVLQDDIVVCSNFAAACQQIASTNPDVPVSLFQSWLPDAARLAFRDASMVGRCYAPYPISQKWAPVLGVLWPAGAARRFLEWATSGVKLPGYPNLVASDDAVLGEWLRRRQEPFLLTVPCLVEHPDREPSLIGKRAQWGKDKARVALDFIGDRDPLQYDW
jgi:hypothetical protein